MDLTAAAWLVEGAEVERELDDIGAQPWQKDFRVDRLSFLRYKSF